MANGTEYAKELLDELLAGRDPKAALDHKQQERDPSISYQFGLIPTDNARS